MRTDDLSLPNDMDLLKAMVRAMADKTTVLEEENAALKARSLDADARIKRLMQILKAYDRARFGRRSEKLGVVGVGADEEAQHAFVFEEIETGIAVLKAQTGQDRASGEKRAPRPRKGFPPHLERVEVVIEPEVQPEHAGKQKVLIGEDISERLDVTPARFCVIVTRRPKYAFNGADGVIQARAPGPHHRKRPADRGAAGADCGLQIRRWPAAVPAGRDLCSRPGGDRPAADGAVDRQGQLRAGDPRCACGGRNSEGSARLRR